MRFCCRTSDKRCERTTRARSITVYMVTTAVTIKQPSTDWVQLGSTQRNTDSKWSVWRLDGISSRLPYCKTKCALCKLFKSHCAFLPWDSFILFTVFVYGGSPLDPKWNFLLSPLFIETSQWKVVLICLCQDSSPLNDVFHFYSGPMRLISGWLKCRGNMGEDMWEYVYREGKSN